MCRKEFTSYSKLYLYPLRSAEITVRQDQQQHQRAIQQGNVLTVSSRNNNTDPRTGNNASQINVRQRS